MPSFEVDADLYDDAGLARLPAKQRAACMGLWALAGMWAVRKGTGGHVPRAMAEQLAGSSREAAQLVAIGLWREAEDGYQFVHWRQSDQSAEPPAPLTDAERASRYRERKRHGGVTDSVTTRHGKRHGGVTDSVTNRVTEGDLRHVGGLGGALSSPSDLSSPSRSPSPPGSESTQLAGCNAPAREDAPQPGRFRWELEELVRAEFSARGVTPQKASPGQWGDGCQTVQDALDLGAYPDAREALEAFAKRLVDAVAAKKPPSLGLALQQVQLGEQLRPVAPGRQLSALAVAALERSRRAAEGT